MTSVNHKRLGDLLNLKRGYDLTEAERLPGPYPVVSSSGVSGYHNDFKVQGPGVVIGRYGTLGEAYYLEERYWPHNTSLYVTDFKGNLPRYIYYLLTCLGRIKTSDKSAVPGVNRNELHEMAVPAITDLDAQTDIVEVLLTLDAKVHLNNQINHELEGMAKLLYDYWFAQFDFPMTAAQAAALGKPKLAGQPYRASGGKMIFNETLKRDIPVDWKVSTIGETFDTFAGGTPSRSNKEFWQPGEINWLSSGENPGMFAITPSEHISRLGLSKSPATLLPKGSVIISLVRHLRASILGIDSATNQSVVGIVETDSIKHCFIYPFIQLEIPRLMRLRTGAQQPHINKGIVDACVVVIPDDDTLASYTQITGPLYEHILINLEQNKELLALRDWLLPMLMNGQVTAG
jgi:type I restriction enzyme S subunit